MANAFVPPPINPALAGPLGMQNPFMPPPAASPSLGFQVYASDPQNAMKVQHAMVPPNQPLQPNAGQPSPMASINPPKPTPMAAVTPPEISQPIDVSGMGGNLASPSVFGGTSPAVQSGAQAKLGQDQAQLQRLQQNGAGLNQIKNPVGRGFAKAGDIALSIVSPGIAALVPGTSLHNRLLQNQVQGRVANDQGAIDSQQKQLTDAANIQHTNAETANLQNPPAKPGNEDKTVDTGDGIFQFNPQTNRYDIKVGPGKDKTTEADKPLTNVPNLQKTLQDRYNVLNPGKPLPSQYQLPVGATQKDYDRVDKAMEAVERAQGTKAQQEQANAFRQQGLDMQRERAEAAANKVTPDEQRRADLANNLNENLTTLKEIVARRPELFGPLAGRWAELKQKFGSDDPDLGTLSTIEHQIGIAQISAHGMRSAQGIQGASDSILNHLHSGPAAINAAVDAAMKSVETFRTDAGDSTPVGQVRTTQHGTAKAAPAAKERGNPINPPAIKGGKQAADPLGIR